MAAAKARCVFGIFNSTRTQFPLSKKRSFSAWRTHLSSSPWGIDTTLRDPVKERGFHEPTARRTKAGELERLEDNGENSASTVADYTSLLNLAHTYTVSPTAAASARRRDCNDDWLIPPLYASTETSMAQSPLGKGCRQRSKRTGPLPYDEIPRTLTHHPLEKSPYGVGNRYRGVFINHLAPGTTHADVTAGIAATAPVGPVTSVRLLQPPPHKERVFGQLRAHVVFGRHQATSRLVRAARDGLLRIKGTAVAVSVDKSVAYHWNNGRRIDSRVLLVRARPDTPGFTEGELRKAMVADMESMKAAGPLGARSEPVVSYEVDEGCVTMEWRFFSHVQAMAMRTAVERAYEAKVEVYKGWDPCWVDEEKGQVPERLNREQAWRSGWAGG